MPSIPVHMVPEKAKGSEYLELHPLLLTAVQILHVPFKEPGCLQTITSLMAGHSGLLNIAAYGVPTAGSS